MKNKKNSNISKDRSKNSKSAHRPNSRNENGRPLRKEDLDYECVSGPGRNDPNWYLFDPAMDNSIYNFPTTSFIGVPESMGQYVDDSVPIQFNYDYTAPSIMVIKLNPSVGITGSAGAAEISPQAAAVNMAALKLYTKLSSINAKTTNYQPQDVMTAVLAVNEVIKMHTFIQRTLSLPFLVNVRNRTYPRTAVAASGVNYDDLKNNISNYRTRFNAITATFKSIPMMDGFKLFNKARVLYKHVIADSDSPMAQTYLFVPESTWVLDEASSEQGSMLSTYTLPYGGSTTMSDLLDVYQDMIFALLNSSTLNFVYSDIINYVNKNGGSLLELDLMPEDYRTEVSLPSQSKDFLMQIMNATVTGTPIAASADLGNTNYNDVLHDVNSNSIIYNPRFARTKAYARHEDFKPILNYPYEPDLSERVESLRLHNEDLDVVVGATDALTSCASQLMDNYIVRIGIINSTADTVDYSSGIWIDRPLHEYSNDLSMNMVRVITNFSQFDYAPLIYLPQWPKDDDASTAVDIVGDVNWHTAISTDTLDAAIFTSFMALYDI